MTKLFAYFSNCCVLSDFDRLFGLYDVSHEGVGCCFCCCLFYAVYFLPNAFFCRPFHCCFFFASSSLRFVGVFHHIIQTAWYTITSRSRHNNIIYTSILHFFFSRFVSFLPILRLFPSLDETEVYWKIPERIIIQ